MSVSGLQPLTALKPQLVQFNVQWPFVYAIYDDMAGTIGTGRVVNLPLKTETVDPADNLLN